MKMSSSSITVIVIATASAIFSYSLYAAVQLILNSPLQNSYEDSIRDDTRRLSRIASTPNPHALKLFKHVENNELNGIYEYASPEIKRQVSYDEFFSSFIPPIDFRITNIRTVSTYSVVREDVEYQLLVVVYERSGLEHFGAIEFRIVENSAHYDRFPFPISMKEEFSPFPPHLRNRLSQNSSITQQ